MRVIGLAGMPKSGKGEASNVLIAQGYGHIVMSDLLREQIMRDTGMQPAQIDRRIMLESARRYREADPGMLARLSIEKIAEFPPGIRGVLIDGIRNPGEIDTLIDLTEKRGDELRLVGVRVSNDFETDCATRYERLMANHFQRGLSYDPPTWEAFVENSRLEWDDPSPAGIHIKTCLAMIEKLPFGVILENGPGKQLDEWHREISIYAQSLEGGYGHPEMK